jgi:hypothetical protein
MDCSICFEELRKGPAIVLPCDHTFHELCIVKWSRYNMTCPQCRADFFLEIVPAPDPLRIVVLLLAAIYLMLFIVYILNSIDFERFKS